MIVVIRMRKVNVNYLIVMKIDLVIEKIDYQGLQMVSLIFIVNLEII